jgi:hypothetical protein
MPHSLNSLASRFTSWNSKLQDRKVRNASQATATPKATAILSTPSQYDLFLSDVLDTTFKVHNSHARHDEFLCEERICENQ